MSRASLLILAGLVGCAPVYSRVDGGVVNPTRHESATPDPEPQPEQADDALARVLGGLVWPLATSRASVVGSPYGMRIHPRSGDPRFHAGLDLRAPAGTPVYAVAAGRVAASGPSGAYGLRVVIEHPGGLMSLYAHQQRTLVREGQSIRRGQPVGMVGHTGNATGDHLHFELLWEGGTVDPRTVLPALGSDG